MNGRYDLTRHRSPGAANYRGRVDLAPGTLMGPTTFGTYLIVNTVDYDAASDRTRATFVVADADDLGQLAGGVS